MVAFCFTFPLCFPSLLYDNVLMKLAVGVPSSSSWFECSRFPVLPVLLWLSFSTFLFSLYVSSSTAQTCKTNTSSFSNQYSSCNDLPVLNSFLYRTYDPSTNTLDFAYQHIGITSSRWNSWAINPTSKGMIGSQALVSFQDSNGAMHA